MSGNYETAVGAMHRIKSGSLGDSLAVIGIAQEEYLLLTTDAPWVVQDRAVVVRTLENLIHGTCDCAGIPRFEVPAEYVVAAIHVFVNPVNAMLICRWMEGSRTADDMISEEGGIEPLEAKMMFALWVQLGNVTDAWREGFEKAVGLKREKAAPSNG